MSHKNQLEEIAEAVRTKLSLAKDWLTAKMEEIEFRCTEIESVAAELEPFEVDQPVVNSLAAVLACPGGNTGNRKVEFRLPDTNAGGPMIVNQEDLRAALIREFSGPVKEAKAAAELIPAVPDYAGLEDFVQASPRAVDHSPVSIGVGAYKATMGELRCVVDFLGLLRTRERHLSQGVEHEGRIEVDLTLRDNWGNEVLKLRRKFGRVRVEDRGSEIELTTSGPVFICTADRRSERGG